MKSSKSSGMSPSSSTAGSGVEGLALFARGLDVAFAFFDGVSSAVSPLRFFGVAGVVVAPGESQYIELASGTFAIIAHLA